MPSVVNNFREQLMKIISYFEALNLYIKVPSKRSGKTEEIIEAYFPKDSSSSIVFSNDGIEIYKIPHTNHNKRTRDVGVQTADRPYSPVTSINRNLTGHSVAWRNNPNIIQQQQQQYYAGNNKNGWNDVDNILDNAKSSLNTLGKQDQVGNYSALYDNDQMEKHRKRMEKKSKRPGFKKDRVKTYGRVNKHHKQKRKIQYQPNDYIDFPRFIIAIEGPGNVENITKDVANYMGWYHICLEDLLIHCVPCCCLICRRIGVYCCWLYKP